MTFEEFQHQHGDKLSREVWKLRKERNELYCRVHGLRHPEDFQPIEGPKPKHRCQVCGEILNVQRRKEYAECAICVWLRYAHKRNRDSGRCISVFKG